jgi:hypothetical protein
MSWEHIECTKLLNHWRIFSQLWFVKWCPIWHRVHASLFFKVQNRNSRMLGNKYVIYLTLSLLSSWCFREGPSCVIPTFICQGHRHYSSWRMYGCTSVMKWARHNLRYYSSICLEGLRTTKNKTLTLDSWHHGYLSWACPKYESEVLLLEPVCLIVLWYPSTKLKHIKCPIVRNRFMPQ